MEPDYVEKEVGNPGRISGSGTDDGPPLKKRGSAWYLWVEFAAFVALTAAVYALIVECSLGRNILAVDELNLDWFSKVVIFWVIWAETVVLFVPVLALFTLPILLGRRKLAQVLGLSGWAVLSFVLTVDLILLTLNGTHLPDWLPYLYDILEAPERNQAQYAGSGMGLGALKVAGVLVAVGTALLALTRWVGRRVLSRFGWLDSRRLATTVGLSLLALTVGSVPALSSLGSPTLVRRIDLVLPLNIGFFEDLAVDSSRVTASLPESFKVPSSQTPPAADATNGFNPSSSQTTEVMFENRTLQDVDLENYCLLSRLGVPLPLNGKLPKGGQATVTLRTDQISRDRFFLVDRDGRVTHRLEREPVPGGIKLIFAKGSRFNDFLTASVNRELVAVKDKYLEDAANPKPPDPEAVVRKTPLPNVILIALESLRHTAITPDLTKRLWAWSNGGLRLERHYSASNCSHLSLFSLLYGRNSLGYGATLDRQIPPQLCTSMSRSGYQCTFLTSHECRQFQRMHEYLNESFFNRVEWLGGSSWEDLRAWPDADRRVCSEIRRIATTPSKQPQFIFAFLLSTHYPYVFDKKFEIHKPCGEQVRIENAMLNRELTDDILINRYRNSMLFLEDELMKLIESLDPERNIVIVTGDHGESLGEDGVLSHNSRASEIQTRVPLLMVGPGIEPRRIAMATSHVDVLPTLLHILEGRSVPIRNCHGRDLLAEDVADTGIAITPILGRDVVIVHGDDRYVFKAHFKRNRPPSVAFYGLIDERGLPKAFLPARPGRF